MGRRDRSNRKQDAPPATPPAEVFRLGAVPGATPGKWISLWRERMPRTRLDLVEIAPTDQRSALLGGQADAALIRLPVERTHLHVIALYDEVPVVVMSTDSALTVAEELSPDDLAGEVLITADDDVLGWPVAGTREPAFAAPAETKAAIELVATGVGILIVPMSLARLHHRKDVTYRPLTDGPTSTVALAWPEDRTTPEVETFIGIVRGRSIRSSRS
ncbi:LysR family substrate-binding domain-containing protein [Microbacterium schleiferi]|uniref:LysR family substrate-binding domain-containing protein n=1 Tax=Microbacterium schleiferi TaxID=69362 RepID=A0A7S8MXQ9_9MICO|nr:LysR family substrate-binding domain-containing protein [Microbacterium schleiferi]QPE04868.1 LysR family substrate-binding domain-containing protein [Microbacterium schleiferi]